MEFLVGIPDEDVILAVRFRGGVPVKRLVFRKKEPPPLPVLVEHAQDAPENALVLPLLFRAVWPEEPNLDLLFVRFALPRPGGPWERAQALGHLFLRAWEEVRAWPGPARRAVAKLLPPGLALAPRPRTPAVRPPASLDEALRRFQALGLEDRAEQRAYAQAVWAAVRQGKAVLLEAGPGTGKTFGYLVPLLLLLRRGGRAVVTTRTRTLQHQLCQRDLPWLRERLGLRVPWALLKGRENHLCLWRWQRLRAQLVPEDILVPLELLALRRADLDEIGFIEDAGLLEELRDRPGRCMGSRCPELARCPSRLAREEARAAQLVVVNHALFSTDIARRNAILGPYDYLVVDEAHALPSVLRETLGVTLTPAEIPSLLAELERHEQSQQIQMPLEEVKRRHHEFWTAVQSIIPAGRARVDQATLRRLELHAAPPPASPAPIGPKDPKGRGAQRCQRGPGRASPIPRFLFPAGGGPVGSMVGQGGDAQPQPHPAGCLRTTAALPVAPAPCRRPHLRHPRRAGPAGVCGGAPGLGQRRGVPLLAFSFHL